MTLVSVAKLHIKNKKTQYETRELTDVCALKHAANLLTSLQYLSYHGNKEGHKTC